MNNCLRATQAINASIESSTISITNAVLIANAYKVVPPTIGSVMHMVRIVFS